MFRILSVAHRIEPARAPTLLVACLLVLLVARDASNDMVASLIESPGAGFVFQGVLMLFAFAAWFFARAALGLHDAVAAGERPRPGPALAVRLWVWWPRVLFGAVAAIGAAVSLRSAATLQALLCLLWAVAGVVLLERRDRRCPCPPPQRSRLPWQAACPFGRPGWWIARVMVAVGLAAFALAAAESYGLRLGVDLPALLSRAAPRVGAAVLCLLLIMGPLTAATMLADHYPWRRGRLGTFRVPVLMLVGGTLLGAAQLLPLHQLRIATAPGPAVADRVGLDDILASFVATCGAADEDTPVRPVIVALSGGASRAALWGARVLRDVDAAARDAHTAVFAVSSVSGGSLGAAAYLALRRDDIDAARTGEARCHLAASPARDQALVEHLSADMLGPLLVGTILDDSARALMAPAMLLVAGQRVPRGGDRAEALERGFSRAWGHPDGVPGWHGFEENFLSFFYEGGTWRAGMPIWISNGTDVRDGRRLLTSPVRPLEGADQPDGVVRDPDWPFWTAGDVLALLGADVPFSTAIHNSARFPLLSPTGAVTPLHPVTDPAARGFGRSPPQIVDGGYFENSGLSTAVELATWLRGRAAHGRPVDPVIVLVTADAEPATGADDVARCDSGPAWAPDAFESGSEVAQIMAPVATLFATRDGHAAYALERARHAFCGPKGDPTSNRFFHFYLHAPPGDEAIPLNWTLSARTAATIWRGMRDDNRGELAALRAALRSPRSNPDASSATAPRTGHSTARLAEREADSAGARTQ